MTGVLAFVHDVDILGLEAYAYIRAYLIEIGRLYEPFEALEIDNGIIMHALEGHRGDRSAQMAVVGSDDIDILGADNDIHRLVLFKAEVNASELASEEFDQSVLKHYAVKDIALADEVRDEGVLRLVIDILGRSDLLDASLVHDYDRVGHA